MRPTAVTAVFAVALVANVALSASCTSADDSFVYLERSDAGAGSFDTTDAAEPAVPPDTTVLQCIGTTCPDGFATCSDGTGPAYKCGSDLKRDVNHCGACGNRCLHYEDIHVTSRCVDGSCELECWNPPNPETGSPREWRDCNSKIDDGCETDVLRNPKHCGACGNACAPGEPCHDGKCGCASGEIVCNGRCVDPMTDNYNCGECGTECDRDDGPCTFPGSSAYYGCLGGVCGQPKCSFAKLDCNGDLNEPSCNTDGCELNGLDSNNCGRCGNKCNIAAGEQCVNEGAGPECAVPCVRFNMTDCGPEQCRDLLNDPRACGSCFRACPAPGPHQEAACRKGICELDCVAGFADCNGDPTDGCETNLLAHPGNCGACGHACNIAAGQPCIAGQCLMTGCDAGIVQ